jgi:beta-mannanase
VPATGQVMLGSYLDLGGRTLRQSLALRRRQLGRDQRILHLFHAWAERMPTAVPEVGRGRLMISWHGVKYAGINNGSQDARIASAARRLADYGKPMLLRWAWEMNGDWFEWGGANNGRNPAAYVSAYRRIHRIFADEGADNVAFVWSPNWNSGPDASWNRMERYYPGDGYVDWVGVSGYNFYQESPATLFRHVVGEYGKRKPIIVTETAAIDHGGQSKADWIGKLSAYVRKTPAIGGVVWFDTDVQHDSDHDFRFDSTAASLAAYREMARSARFSG